MFKTIPDFTFASEIGRNARHNKNTQSFQSKHFKDKRLKRKMLLSTLDKIQTIVLDLSKSFVYNLAFKSLLKGWLFEYISRFCCIIVSAL